MSILVWIDSVDALCSQVYFSKFLSVQNESFKKSWVQFYCFVYIDIFFFNLKEKMIIIEYWFFNYNIERNEFNFKYFLMSCSIDSYTSLICGTCSTWSWRFFSKNFLRMMHYLLYEKIMMFKLEYSERNICRICRLNGKY